MKTKMAYVGDYSKLPEWAQRDIQDMEDSRQTSFSRCPKCNRLSDEGYYCFHCGYNYADES